MTDIFPQAVALHRAGRLDEAESLYRNIINSAPDHADSLNLLGVLALQRGDPAQSMELIRRAVAILPDRPTYYCNLASALRALGRYDESAEASRNALSLAPDQREAYLNLGLAHQGARRWSEAAREFKVFSERWPDDPRGLQSLGDCYREEGRISEAIAAYRSSLARFPDSGQVHFVLGTMLLAADELGAAESHLRKAAQLQPQSMITRLNLASCLGKLGREQEAQQTYGEALRLAPENEAAAMKLCDTLMRSGDRAGALQWLSALLEANPNNPEALYRRAELAFEQGEPLESAQILEHLMEICPNSAVYQGLAKTYWELGRNERAEELLAEAVQRFPESAEAQAQLATALVTRGDHERGADAYRKALQIDPQSPTALSGLAQLLGKNLPDDEFAAIHRATKTIRDPRHLADLHFSIAAIADARHEYADAVEHAKTANRLVKDYFESRNLRHDPDADRRHIDRLIATFTPALFARMAPLGSKCEQPVFVFGMPRSGTTLVEQILASHPRVAGAGECPFSTQSLGRLPRELGIQSDPLSCVARLTPDAARACSAFYLEQLQGRAKRTADRIIDKLPDNYLLLGWLAILFPNARFIHCRRDLRDVALSCWMTNFKSINWATDIRHIARRIGDYCRIMAYWNEVLPVRIFDIDYERVVADQEAESRRLIQYLGLEWDDSCLAFHKSKRIVKTASVIQVRRPIYTQSMARWKQYIEVLRPLIDELGLESE
jgi:tetratricopeptide (TPR) repeat protein